VQCVCVCVCAGVCASACWIVCMCKCACKCKMSGLTCKCPALYLGFYSGEVTSGVRSLTFILITLREISPYIRDVADKTLGYACLCVCFVKSVSSHFSAKPCVYIDL